MKKKLPVWRLFFVVGCALLGAGVANAERYAVLIGINNYKDSKIPKLTGAAADARSIAKTLVDYDGFKRQNVHLLVSDGKPSTGSDDSLPTKDNISVQLQWLVSVVKKGDTVLFFYAGHGIQYNNQSWLLPFNSNVRGPIVLENTSLSADQIQRQLNELPNCLLVTAYDMCRKTENIHKKGTSRGIELGLRFGQLQERSSTPKGSPSSNRRAIGGTISIFACQPGQFSWESRTLGRGFFSRGLEAALTNAADSKGVLTVERLVEYLHDRVMSESDAFGLSEVQEPDAIPSSFVVLRQKFATGLKPGQRGWKFDGKPRSRGVITDLASRDPEDEYLALFQSGFSLYRKKKYSLAQQELEAALAVRRTPSVLRIIGDCRYKQHDVKGAQAYFNLALAEDPKYSPAYSDLGYLEDIEFKRPTQAEQLYRKAVECDPENPAPVNNLSRVLRELKRFKECLDMCRAAVELDPNNGLFEANLALELHNQHHDDEAMEHAIRAKELGLEEHLVFERLNIQSSPFDTAPRS